MIIFKKPNSQVKVDHTASKRDLAALKKFCDENYHAALLDCLRLAFASDPGKISEKTDLTMGLKDDQSEANKAKYEAFLEDLKRRRQCNDSHFKTLKVASHIWLSFINSLTSSVSKE